MYQTDVFAVFLSSPWPGSEGLALPAVSTRLEVASVPKSDPALPRPLHLATADMQLFCIPVSLF